MKSMRCSQSIIVSGEYYRDHMIQYDVMMTSQARAVRGRQSRQSSFFVTWRSLMELGLALLSRGSWKVYVMCVDCVYYLFSKKFVWGGNLFGKFYGHKLISIPHFGILVIDLSHLCIVYSSGGQSNFQGGGGIVPLTPYKNPVYIYITLSNSVVVVPLATPFYIYFVRLNFFSTYTDCFISWPNSYSPCVLYTII